ncbi:MAE_28990/MAE_18760 family HEPN-like nuclease [Alcanivorax sp. MM125-6]|nr:MAE_28990/MAE_18760 family HEPN-like nuclease [Alcanivorax sp. MM125-6]
MTDLLKSIEQVDALRLNRARELSELKVRMTEAGKYSKYGVHSKALIVLAYASWEGFYNECVQCFVDALKKSDKKVGDVSWALLVGLLKPNFQRLRDRNHSSEAESQFVNDLRSVINRDFTEFDANVISSRSNLDFKKLQQNFDILGFDLSPFQRYRIRINKELVGWRHSVAHGDEPDLSSVDLRHHVKLTQHLLLLLSDTFQENILLQCSYDLDNGASYSTASA